MEQQRIPCTILIKRRVAGPPGPPDFLNVGELAFNEADDTLCIGTTDNKALSAQEDN
jgi:hypothetical protein